MRARVLDSELYNISILPEAGLGAGRGWGPEGERNAQFFHFNGTMMQRGAALDIPGAEGICDLRLFQFDGRTWASGFAHAPGPRTVMYILELKGGRWERRVLTGAGASRYEKNWIPFVYEGELFLVYLIHPAHIVMRCNPYTGECERITHTWTHAEDWTRQYGAPYGGTPPVLTGDTFTSCFHSQVKEGKESNARRLYYAGLYRFSAKPPFRVVAIARTPVVGPSLTWRCGAPPEQTRSWMSAESCVVFPMSMLSHGNGKGVVLTVGAQDRMSWIMFADWAELDKTF